MLTEEANAFLYKNCRVEIFDECPNCHLVLDSGLEMKAVGDDYIYTLKDGTKIREVTQFEDFRCLEKDGQRLFTWSDQAIADERSKDLHQGPR
jgi:hypothetical protein